MAAHAHGSLEYRSPVSMVLTATDAAYYLLSLVLPAARLLSVVAGAACLLRGGTHVQVLTRQKAEVSKEFWGFEEDDSPDYDAVRRQPVRPPTTAVTQQQFPTVTCVCRYLSSTTAPRWRSTTGARASLPSASS